MGIDVKKVNKVKMLVLDVDGIMTDCRLWMDSDGEWKRIYSVRDGVGIKRLIEHGYKLAIITGAKAQDVRARAKMLGFHYFFEGAQDKMPSFAELQQQSGLAPEEMAYMGDDIFDIPILEQVSFGATVPEAVDEVIASSDYVTKRPGGNGAVREVCDYIFKYGALSNSK